MHHGTPGENAGIRAADRVDKKQLGGIWFRVFGEVLSRVAEALEHDLTRLDEDRDARTRVKLLVRFIVCASVTNLVSQASACGRVDEIAEKSHGR